MDWKVKASVRTSVGDQLGIGLGIGFQLGEDILVTLAGEKEGPLYPRKPGSLIGESSQFIRQSYFANPGTDIVDRTEQIPQVGDGRNSGIGPGVASLSSGDSGKEQRWCGSQFFRLHRKDIDTSTIGSCGYLGLAQTAADSCFMVGACQVWNSIG